MTMYFNRDSNKYNNSLNKKIRNLFQKEIILLKW